ncbi:MAG: hypothetical protein JWP89_129 [Schlesneria sp.]|nr:hypothetical protein [Schlesneria sp.]
MAFVFAYRCGAVPDLHRIPSYRDHDILWSTSNGTHYILPAAGVNSGKSESYGLWAMMRKAAVWAVCHVRFPPQIGLPPSVVRELRRRAIAMDFCNTFSSDQVLIAAHAIDNFISTARPRRLIHYDVVAALPNP